MQMEVASEDGSITLVDENERVPAGNTEVKHRAKLHNCLELAAQRGSGRQGGWPGAAPAWPHGLFLPQFRTRQTCVREACSAPGERKARRPLYK